MTTAAMNGTSTDPSRGVVLRASVSPRYGKLIAARDIDVEVAAGEIFALLGPNGAGKSSTAECLAGRVAGAGPIELDERRIDGMPAHKRVRSGLALVPENRGLFPTLTVDENLALGAAVRGRSEKVSFDLIFDLFPVLASRRPQKAGTLSGGEQEMLAISRAMVTGPKVLILDEPTQGLAPVVLDHIVAALKELRREGVAILLIEQNVGFVARLADRYSIVTGGRVVVRSETGDGLDDPAGLFQSFVGD